MTANDTRPAGFQRAVGAVDPSWWWPGPSWPDQRAVLFFPPAGGDQGAAIPLIAHLAGTRLGVLRPPGRGLRRDEPALLDPAEAAAQLASSVLALGGPAPVLVGHSLGGLAAFAVAQELDRRGRPAACLVAVASTAPGAWREHLSAQGGADPEGHEDYVARRTSRLLQDGAVPATILADPELAAAAEAALEADVRLSCRLGDPTPVNGPITSVVARDDNLVDAAASAAWRAATSGRFEELTVRGGHFFYRTDPGLLASVIRGEVDQLDGGYQFG